MSPTRMSRLETAIRVVLEYHEAFNRHDVDGMMRLMSDDCVFENTGPAPDGEVYSGKDAIARFLQDFFRHVPQSRLEIEEIFSLGLRCIMRWKFHWTDAAGKQAYLRGVDIFKLKDGSICEKLSYASRSQLPV